MTATHNNPSAADWLVAAENHWLDAIAWRERSEGDAAAASAVLVEACHVEEHWRALYESLQEDGANDRD